MTCIVGIREGNRVWIGADACGSNGWRAKTYRQSKLARRGPFLIGGSGDFRMIQLFAHVFTPPPLPPHSSSYMTYLCADFVNALRTCFKDAGYAATEDGREHHSGAFLLGFAGRLFRVDSNYQVLEPQESFEAIGSGEEYALGSLSATGRMAVSAPDRVLGALQAAARYGVGVQPPFSISYVDSHLRMGKVV